MANIPTKYIVVENNMRPQKSCLSRNNGKGGRVTPESVIHSVGRRKKVTIGAVETTSTKASMPQLERMKQTEGSQSHNDDNNDSTTASGSLPNLEVAPTLESRIDDEHVFREQFDERYLPAITNDDAATTSDNNATTLPPNQVGLSWRSNPSTSFSDWILEVVALRAGGGNNIVVSKSRYYCHSNVLAWGPRKCDKFLQLFQERMQAVPPPRITQIRLRENGASVFPMLLDFLYCQTGLPLSCGNACSLYELADLFEAPELLVAIQVFVEKSLNLTQSIEFLSTAKDYENKTKVEKLVLFVNSKLCAYLVQHPKDAELVPPELLAHMLNLRSQCIKVLKGEDPRKYNGDWEVQRSELLSIVVAKCCHEAINTNDSNKQLKRKTFQSLVHPTNLPAVDIEAALLLLRVDRVTSVVEEDEQTSIASDESVAKPDEKFSSLERRCLHALAEKWRLLFKWRKQTITEELKQVAPHILAELLVLISVQYEDSIKKAEKSTIRMEDLFKQLSYRQTRRPDGYEYDDGSSNQHVIPCPEVGSSWGEVAGDARAYGNRMYGDLVDAVQRCGRDGGEDDSYTDANSTIRHYSTWHTRASTHRTTTAASEGT